MSDGREMRPQTKMFWLVSSQTLSGHTHWLIHSQWTYALVNTLSVDIRIG